ncbi:nuclear transport factor 2-like protein [Terriglobus albidus]|uniref:hypothetical protein n=1 Tax=Terriglobus albidus TaxID=1592106 RepID=UPI0021DF741B|nr:hypothetical protein [Terriglobus albidus]
MNTTVITNPVVRLAIDALQKGDTQTWQSLFAPDAQFFDDGQPRNLTQFSNDAMGHERFLSIDHVSDNGLLIEGKFHSDTWGEFRTYFRFVLNRDGKITRLDIGQVG